MIICFINAEKFFIAFSIQGKEKNYSEVYSFVLYFSWEKVTLPDGDNSLRFAIANPSFFLVNNLVLISKALTREMKNILNWHFF